MPRKFEILFRVGTLAIILLKKVITDEKKKKRNDFQL